MILKEKVKWIFNKGTWAFSSYKKPKCPRCNQRETMYLEFFSNRTEAWECECGWHEGE